MEALRKRMSSIKQFQLPRVSPNIPIACHPDCASISQEVDEWFIEKMRIERESEKKKVHECKFGALVSLMHPHGVKERVILQGKHMRVIFMLDDVVEKSTKHKMAELKSMIMKIATSGSFEASGQEDLLSLDLFQEVMAEARAKMPPSLFSRYLMCLKDHLDGVESEVEHTMVDCSVPAPDVYRLLRRKTVFAEGSVGIFTEFSVGIQLQDHDVQSSEYREFLDCIADHCGLVNDLVSFRKEYYQKSESFSHNWISVLFHHSPENSHFQEVINRLCDMIQEEEVKILNLQKRLLEKAAANQDTELQKFANEFPLIASGHFQWCYITARYHGYDNKLLTGEFFHGTLLLHPEATIIISQE